MAEDAEPIAVIVCGVSSEQIVRMNTPTGNTKKESEPVDFLVCGINQNNEIKVIAPSSKGIFQ